MTHRRFAILLLGPVVLGSLALSGCATQNADRYSAREFDVGALLVELQAVPRASTSIITAADINALPAGYTVEEVLAHSAGIYLRRRHEPGGEMTVYVLGAENPLFVIDGVPYDQGGYVPVNARDVERIEMFKYGAGTALYGLRGSNGVIVITTKK